MSDLNVLLPSKPKIIKEEGFTGTYEIDGLYPGYGHTLGNSIRRIILSSLPGAAITRVKIDGVSHEFSTIEGIKVLDKHENYICEETISFPLKENEKIKIGNLLYAVSYDYL